MERMQAVTSWRPALRVGLPKSLNLAQPCTKTPVMPHRPRPSCSLKGPVGPGPTHCPNLLCLPLPRVF